MEINNTNLLILVILVSVILVLVYIFGQDLQYKLQEVYTNVKDHFARKYMELKDMFQKHESNANSRLGIVYQEDIDVNQEHRY